MQTEGTHQKKYECCGAEYEAVESHKWEMDIAVYVDMAVNIQVERQPVQKKQSVLFVISLMESR